MSWGGTDLRFAVNNVGNESMADAMTINYLGKVGIGTTTPNAKLQVNVASNADVAFAVYRDNTEQFRIMGDGKFYGRGYKIKAEPGTFPD